MDHTHCAVYGKYEFKKGIIHINEVTELLVAKSRVLVPPVIIGMLQVFHKCWCLGNVYSRQMGGVVVLMQMHRPSTRQKAVDGDIRPNTQTVIADGALLVATLLW